MAETSFSLMFIDVLIKYQMEYLRQMPNSFALLTHVWKNRKYLMYLSLSYLNIALGNQ